MSEDPFRRSGSRSCVCQPGLDHPEVVLEHPHLSKPLSEVDRGYIRNAIHHAQTNILLEGALIIGPKFSLFIAESKQQLKDQNLEQDQRINPLSPRVALPVLRDAFLK